MGLIVITNVITLYFNHFFYEKVSESKRGYKKGVSKTFYKIQDAISHAEEPVASYTSRIRAIGNSKGVIIFQRTLIPKKNIL